MPSSDTSVPPLRLRLEQARIMPCLWAVMVILLGLGLAASTARAITGRETLLGLVPLFDVDREQSVPTFFSACLLLGAAGLLALAASVERSRQARFAAHWAGLAVGFFYLAADEVAGFHEQFGPLARFLVSDAHPTLSRCWAIFGLVGVILVGGLYFRFVRSLPPRLRQAFLTAGFIYIGGAVGVELFSTLHWHTHPTGWSHVFLPILEEGMEMAGVIMFVGTLLRHLAGTKLAVAVVEIASAATPMPARANATELAPSERAARAGVSA